MDLLDTIVALSVIGVRLAPDTNFDYSLTGGLSKLIFALSALVGAVIYLVRRHTQKTRSNEDAWWDILTTLIFVVSLALAAIRWLEFTLIGSAVASDFTQDYVAAVALRHQTSLYGAPVAALAAKIFQFEIMGNYQPEILNFHPPFNALLFLPISYIPYTSAFISWNIVSTLIYVWTIYLLLRAYGLATFRRLQLCTILLVWEPFSNTVALGQISTMLAFLIVWGFLLLEREQKETAAGLMFGFATLIKLFPGLILVYLLLRRRWRCASVMVITIFTGLFLTLIVVGLEDNLYYLHSLLPEHVRVYGAFPFNISVPSVVRTIFDRTDYTMPAVMAPEAVQGVILLTNGFFLALPCLLGFRFAKYDSSENLFILFCVTMLLISPITWPHTCLVLLLPMTILWRDGLIFGQRNALRLLIVLLFIFSIPDRILVRDVLSRYPPGATPWYAVIPAKLALYALLALWATFSWRMASYRRGIENEAIVPAG